MSEPVRSIHAGDAEKVGKRLYVLRRRAGLSVRQVSKRAELGRGQYADMEAGRVEPWASVGIVELYRISRALQCHISELFPEPDDLPPVSRPPGAVEGPPATD